MKKIKSLKAIWGVGMGPGTVDVGWWAIYLNVKYFMYVVVVLSPNPSAHGRRLNLGDRDEAELRVSSSPIEQRLIWNPPPRPPWGWQSDPLRQAVP